MNLNNQTDQFASVPHSKARNSSQLLIREENGAKNATHVCVLSTHRTQNFVCLFNSFLGEFIESEMTSHLVNICIINEEEKIGSSIRSLRFQNLCMLALEELLQWFRGLQVRWYSIYDVLRTWSLPCSKRSAMSLFLHLRDSWRLKANLHESNLARDLIEMSTIIVLVKKVPDTNES